MPGSKLDIHTPCSENHARSLVQVGFGIGRCAVEIGHDLRIRRFRNNRSEDLLKVGHLRNIFLARKKFGRNSKVAYFCETATNILNVLVDDKYYRKIFAAAWSCAVGRDFAICRRNQHFSGDEATIIAGDCAY